MPVRSKQEVFVLVVWTSIVTSSFESDREIGAVKDVQVLNINNGEDCYAHKQGACQPVRQHVWRQMIWCKLVDEGDHGWISARRGVEDACILLRRVRYVHVTCFGGVFGDLQTYVAASLDI